MWGASQCSTALKAADILCAALADPHPGNIAVDAEGEGRLIYYDFGMMGTIPGDVREGLLELFYGVYQKDPDRCGPSPRELVLRQDVALLWAAGMCSESPALPALPRES